MPENRNTIATVGLVAIGRNEGERLRKCLLSVVRQAGAIVYVDSGSSDGSAEMARALGVEVIGLDMTVPFTAARARNEGFRRLRARAPELRYVQFVDGDCEVMPEWLEHAVRFLDRRPDVAVVSGRCRERFPDRSVYNMLCDIEWDAPVGSAKACGGNAMMRADALERAGGFHDGLIAGEEPELCVRFRAAGWKIWRLGDEMVLHDAAIMRFGQWWKRAVRGGYGYAEGYFMHGAPPERYRVRESRRIWAWGVGAPALAAMLAAWLGPWGWALLLVYPAQVARLALRGARTRRENWWRALFLVLGKFPEAAGQLKFLYNRLAGKSARLIEYK